MAVAAVGVCCCCELLSNDLNATNGILKKSGSSNEGNRLVLTGAGCGGALTGAG